MRQKFRTQLGTFLKKMRGESTSAQFSKKVGISSSTLHRIELGQQNVTIDTLEHITIRLKVTLSEIFGEPKA